MKISIITVCFNSSKTIEDTIKSVLKQTYKNYEYLIIDGKSNDNTLDIIKKYESLFEGRLKYVSEKDNGLYDAMNKGIHMATGDIIGTLNADDVLVNEKVFEKIVNSYQNDTDILYGNVLYCDEFLKEVKRNYISGINKSYAFCPAHPTMYVRKEIYEEIGDYDLAYKVTADYDMMIRLNKANKTFTYLNEYLVLMRIGGTSNGFKGYLKNFKDCYHVLKKNKIKFPLCITIKRTFKTLKQIIFNKKIDIEKIK